MRTKINLTCTSTQKPDLSGFKFFVESGREFDADLYAEAYNIDRDALDPRNVSAMQDAAAKLAAGWWLEVTHDAMAHPDIRAWRRARNLSAATAAALVGVTGRSWLRWESGAQTIPAALWELAQIKARIISPSR